MKLKRVLSGVIGFPIVALIFIYGNKYIIDAFIGIISIIAMYDYLKCLSVDYKPVKWVAYLSCAIVAMPSFITTQQLTKTLIYLIPFVLLILFSKVIATDMKTTFKDMAYTLLGICYIPTFIMFLTMIDKMQNGKILLGYIFIASWGTDVFAYSVGCRFGKHKFSKVSPKKSIEGCIAGTIGSTVLALIYTIILNNVITFEYSYFIVGISGIALSLIGQLGDFSASCIKRYVDIKDYSNLLPGHGGMLDRIDSVLFIAPFAYMLFTMI